MTCTSPIDAWQLDDGTVVFDNKSKTIRRELELPCGQCMDCKLERSRQWAVRISHEAQLYEHNWFVTLTYAEDKVPRELIHHHYQDFFKRLRKAKSYFDVNTWSYAPRYFMCGEYGGETGRPHFHACVFGLYLNDLKLYSANNGNTLWTSEFLTKCWGKGHVTFGRVTFESAQYVAAYCTKKVTGEKAEGHYTRLDLTTGELFQVTPEYARMSLKPGIGAHWLHQFTDDVYNFDHVIMNGREQKPPKYYDKLLAKEDPERHEQLGLPRYQRAQASSHNNTRARREAQRKITSSKLEARKGKL